MNAAAWILTAIWLLGAGSAVWLGVDEIRQGRIENGLVGAIGIFMLVLAVLIAIDMNKS